MRESDLTEQIIGGAIRESSEWFCDVPLLFLPFQTVRANLRLAILGVKPGVNQSAYRPQRTCEQLASRREAAKRQSLICADLSSESPWLRGESSCTVESIECRLGERCRKR
jgi:hypothetical protein